MFSFLTKLFDENEKTLRSYQKIVHQINALEPKYQKLSDADFPKQTKEFKKKLAAGQSLDTILPAAFAATREAVNRTIGERAYDVQLLAALTLHYGGIAEQRTGEGKTHSVIFPAYLNALTGLGVHIVTPNDYLSKVGAGWYPKALHFLGLTTSCIIHEQSFILDPDYTDQTEKIDDRLAHLRPIERKEAYQADVTYGTNNEFGFDYLRDHMVSSFDQMVQRPHHYAIVDEVDFVLIDEARTPLIISSPDNSPIQKYGQFAQIAADLQPTDYVIDEKARSATLSEYGIRKVERVLGVKNLYEESFETIHHIENAIKARAIFKKDTDYVIKDGQIIIVDEFTGRLMHGRRWSDGLHQAIEAKEGVTIQKESKTWATITFQNYFRLYQKLAGMTGTAITEAEEFKKIYNLDVLVIPTNKSIIRQDMPDFIFKTQRAKYTALANQVRQLHQRGQPVLIGTTSIDKNEVVSSLLRKLNIPHQVLNAKNHQQEAKIISQAGVAGAVTVATNMAGRGVDIVLGGPKDGVDPKTWQKRHQHILDLGGLAVLGTERHESRRIDNQLRGRSGRQGDPGLSQFYVALDDDLMRIFGGEKISSLMTRFNMPENEALTHPLVSKVLEQIQIKVEGYNFDVRKSVVEYDDVINKQRTIVYNLRDSTLKNEKTDPGLNQKQVFSHLQKQIESIVGINSDPEKIVLEFSEILPMQPSTRQKLVNIIKKQTEPTAYLFDLITKEWQQRLKYFGADISNNILTFSVITSLDPLWVDHLSALDDLRSGVRLRGYAQKDPLVEYRKEGYDMFQDLMAKFEYNLARKIFRIQPVNQANLPVTPQNVTEGRADISDMTQPVPNQSQSQTVHADQPTPGQTIIKPVRSNQNAPGRNDPCPCGKTRPDGTPKKYKHCCYPQYG